MTRRPQNLGIVLLIALLSTACAGSGPAAKTSAKPPGTASEAAAGSTPSGCGPNGATGTAVLNLTIDNRQRLVIVHLPTAYTGRTQAALVLNMHGSGSTARQQEALSGMDATADRDGFIVAYPQALIAAGGGFDWNVPGMPLLGGAYPPSGAADDVAFVTELASDLAGRYCVDRHRVYATGISGGGRMASQLACDSPGTFAAVAPVAGLRFPSPCPANSAVPVLAFHGTADPVDPYNGNGQAYWTYSVPTAAQRWAAHDGCGPDPQTTRGTGYTMTSYGGCSSGAAVELLTVSGEGHEWPGGPRLPAALIKVLGPQSDSVDANARMWEFFSSHPGS